VSRNLKQLEEVKLISKKQLFTKNGIERNDRHDKSTWQIVLHLSCYEDND
jgi:hypothetical protein